MWRARLASSRTVILLAGSGSPLELPKVDLVSPSSRARLVMKSVAKIRSLPAMPSASAMQESLPLWMMAPCRRSSTETLLLIAANIVEPPAGAPPLRQAFSLMRYSSVSLTSPCLDGVEDHLGRHQLHHAGRRPQLVGVLLEQHAAAGGLDQDRGRRVAVEAALVLLGALHAVVGGVDDAAPADRQQPTSTAAIRPRHGQAAAASDLRETVSRLPSRCPEARRSNSWKYRKQHRFSDLCRAAVRLRRRSNDPIVRTTAIPTKYEKQGGNAMPSSRTISANGIELFVLEQGQGPLVVLCHGWPELSYSWRHQIPAHRRSRFPCRGARYARLWPHQRARGYRRLQHLRQCRRHGRAGRSARREAGRHRRP